MSDAVATAPTPGHELLLGLAGWVDDDLLAIARELVAVGEEAGALELLVASLAADRTVLPHPVRARLAGAAERRIGGDLAGLLPPGAPLPDRTAHVFTADVGDASGAERIREVVAGLTAVARSGARTIVTWRLTPTGAAPGPVPHPVVLLVLDGPAPAEVITYQVGAALARAGITASVEVFVDGSALPPYQRAALAAAGVPDRASTAPSTPDHGDPGGARWTAGDLPHVATPTSATVTGPYDRGAETADEPYRAAPEAPSWSGPYAAVPVVDPPRPGRSAARGRADDRFDELGPIADPSVPALGTASAVPGPDRAWWDHGATDGPSTSDTGSERAVGDAGSAASVESTGAATPAGNSGAPVDDGGPGAPTGDPAASPPTGDRAASPPTGDRAASPPTGDRAASPPTGDRAGSVPSVETTESTPPVGDARTPAPDGGPAPRPVASPTTGAPAPVRNADAGDAPPGAQRAPTRQPAAQQPAAQQPAAQQPAAQQPAAQQPAAQQPAAQQPAAERPAAQPPHAQQPIVQPPSTPPSTQPPTAQAPTAQASAAGPADVDPARFDPARNAVDRTVHGGAGVPGRPEIGANPTGGGGSAPSVGSTAPEEPIVTDDRSGTDPDPLGGTDGHPSPRPAPRPGPRPAPAEAPDGGGSADPPVNGHASHPPADGEREWERQWGTGSWSTPGGAAPDPDLEPATSPTPTTPPLSRVPPSPSRRSSGDEEPNGTRSRHRLDTPEPVADAGEDALDSRLTPNEQELLRRLQQELAAREGGSGESPRNGTSYPSEQD